MIDAFSILMALTLLVAGLFLCRDHVRFLKSSYSMNGKVVSIQHVFLSALSGEQPPKNTSMVESGFYPVIEYYLKGGAVSFTAIDPDASGRFHVGEDVKLRVIKTRRKENRSCRNAFILSAMLAAMCFSLMLDMWLSGIGSVQRVFVASGVMATCLAILVAYARDCDEHGSRSVMRTPGGKLQLSLFEPTAFQKWGKSQRDARQRSKIRNKQMVGLTCVFSAAFMVAMTVS